MQCDIKHIKPFAGYKDGLEMWRDYVLSYDIDEAIIICRNYLMMNLHCSHKDDEAQFCCELFGAMYEATAGRTDPNMLIYPYSLEAAAERMEDSHYRLSLTLNAECARGIDRLINESCYEPNFHNLEIAAMIAVMDYGFQRVCMVSAFNYQFKGRDGRFSAANRQWANNFIVHEKSFGSSWLQAHPVLIDGFCNHLRRLYQSLCAERYALPGKAECGEFVGNVEIKRAIITSVNGNGFITGYAIGHNPEAVSPWVCWQFAVREGKRHYNWGVYCQEEQAAADSYIARVFVAFNNKRTG
jgi:hypothetical protein